MATRHPSSTSAAMAQPPEAVSRASHKSSAERRARTFCTSLDASRNCLSASAAQQRRADRAQRVSPCTKRQSAKADVAPHTFVEDRGGHARTAEADLPQRDGGVARLAAAAAAQVARAPPACNASAEKQVRAVAQGLPKTWKRARCALRHAYRRAATHSAAPRSVDSSRGRSSPRAAARGSCASRARRPAPAAAPQLRGLQAPTPWRHPPRRRPSCERAGTRCCATQAGVNVSAQAAQERQHLAWCALRLAAAPRRAWEKRAGRRASPSPRIGS